jgi:hypothetical protein
MASVVRPSSLPGGGMHATRGGDVELAGGGGGMGRQRQDCCGGPEEEGDSPLHVRPLTASSCIRRKWHRAHEKLESLA